MHARLVVTLTAVVLLLVCADAANAIVFKFAQGERAGSANFTREGDTLVVTLSNTSAFDVVQPDQLLNAVLFKLEGNPGLTPVSAFVAPGSTILFDSNAPADGNVGGEWTYKTDLFNCDFQGISSTGLDDVFGPKDVFPPAVNLDGPASPGGANYGLTSPWDDPTLGNSKVTGGVPMIQSTVVFRLDGLSPGFNPAMDVTDVWFQYGTSQSEPRFPSVRPPDALKVIPEPITATGLLLGLAGLGRYVRQRRR